MARKCFVYGCDTGYVKAKKRNKELENNALNKKLPYRRRLVYDNEFSIRISSKKALFHDIHQQIQEQNEKDDKGLRTTRTQFLLRATSAVAQSFPEMAPESTTNTEYINQKDFLTASKWFNHILDIGGCWDLDLDEIRRHYICELYSGGQDLLAHEMKNTVTNRVLLASQLLMIAGQRIHKVIFDCADPTTRLGVLTPDVSFFLKKLGDITLRCNNVPLHLTETLLDHILSVLPESSKEHKLASALKTATGDLKEIVTSS